MKHFPRIIKVDPRRIIPHHASGPTPFWIALYQNNPKLIPPIPVVKAPGDLRHLGDYVNYNGHHRTKSAISASVFPECFLIQSNSDLAYLEEVSEVYQEIIEGLGSEFSHHYSFVCGQARYFQNLKRIGLSRVSS